MFKNQTEPPLEITGPDKHSQYRARMADGTWTQPHPSQWWDGDSVLHRSVRKYIHSKVGSKGKFRLALTNAGR